MAAFASVHNFMVVLMSVAYLSHGHYTSKFHLSGIALQIKNDTGRHTSVRSGDPSFIVPHLFQGDSLFVLICTDDWTNISFANITFSNDGDTDRIAVSLDGLHVGEFDTLAHSDWGLLWDDFYGSGYIGHSGMIPPGQHRAEITVVSSDCHGVELGTVYIETDKPVRGETIWCGYGHEFATAVLECTPSENRLAQQKAPVIPLPNNYMRVTQYSFKSDCLDTKNVRVAFRSRDLTGTTISASQENSLASRSVAERNKSSGARFCKNRIWQLGLIDGDNKEFKPIISQEKITINMTGTRHKDSVFPAKILPFVTREIVLNFNLPENANVNGSAFFALGLINLTKRADIGFQFYDHTTKGFSDIHFITFTPTWHVMGWNIPDLSRVLHRNNTFKLHFVSESNVIMFDFLKLEYYHRDARKLNLLLSQGDKWKVRGLRYSNSKGVQVYINSDRAASDVEELVLLYKVSPFRHYQNVVRIHSDGFVYIYRPYFVNLSEQEKVFVDVSGFLFTTSSDNKIRFNNPASEIYLNTTSDTLAINYKDRSVVHLKLIADISHTKIQIVNFQVRRDQSESPVEQTILFTSTHVTDYLAAVNEISVDGVDSRKVLSDLSDYNGGTAYVLRKTSPTNMYYSNNVLEINVAE